MNGASESSLKLMSPHNCQGLSQRYKLQPRVIRVTAYKNGSGTAFANIIAPTIALVLEACTHKLNLNMAARRVFLADGTEALKPEDIPHESNVYVSAEKPFVNPFKKIKEMMIYAGDQSRQLAVAYVTASGKLEKLEVAFQNTSI
ncbi:hypothetical protein U0070_024368 [Myodes glareolus]|uniref:DCDC1 second doublecortin-like domain-containing protein n=1 Tax=Myodes glareolus TaxID=447135 RepID=A0AAW0IK94_MYOGA